jgi:serine protease Do
MIQRSRGVVVSGVLVSFLCLASCKRDPAGATAAGRAASSAGAPTPVASGVPAAEVPTAPHATAPTPTPAAVVVSPGGPGAPMSFAALVKKSDPGVVTVLADTRTSRGRTVMQGFGTGFVYDPSGYILTNNHVIERANVIHVRLANDRRVPAKLVGRDPYTDVAVLKVEAPEPLHALPLGDSNAVDIGDWVYAIGNPFGLSHTVSAGILSAKGRTQELLEGLDRTGRGYFNFLQTDAAINQGNSGGPLLNLSGEVVGINTAIRANANSIGFAIPINMVKSLLPMLVKDGKVTRSALGISVRVVSEEDVERLKRTDRKGAMVGSVAPGGPADKAGLAEDDIIVAFDGVTVADPNELRWLASIAGVGKEVTVKVSRGTRVFDVKATLGALPGNPDDDEEPAAPHTP